MEVSGWKTNIKWWDISTPNEFFVNQKRVYVREHTVMVAPHCAIFTVCSQTFTLFLLTKSSVSVKMSHNCLCALLCMFFIQIPIHFFIHPFLFPFLCYPYFGAFLFNMVLFTGRWTSIFSCINFQMTYTFPDFLNVIQVNFNKYKYKVTLMHNRG